MARRRELKCPQTVFFVRARKQEELALGQCSFELLSERMFVPYA